MKKNRGFSLLELLIVVAIILIIATIAIPSLLRSRQAANETSAVSNLRTLNTAEVSYSASQGGSYATIAELAAAGLTDTRFENGPISGFSFTNDISANRLDYTLYATAVSDNSARFDYYTTPDYVIRYSTAISRSPAGLNGEPAR